MLSNPYTITFGNMLLVVGGVSAYHYLHVGSPTSIKSLAAIVNGTTINSAGDVVITFNRLRGGATLALGTINLPNGTAAGVGVSSTLAAAVELLPGDRLQATVTTFATVAGGAAMATVELSNG